MNPYLEHTWEEPDDNSLPMRPKLTPPPGVLSDKDKVRIWRMWAKKQDEEWEFFRDEYRRQCGRWHEAGFEKG